MFCPKCGAQNQDGAKFCAGCGQPMQVNSGVPQTQAGAQVPAAPQAQTSAQVTGISQQPIAQQQPIVIPQPQVVHAQPVPVVNQGKSVSKVTYVLLAFFLGGLGVHNFYAGKTGLGILYLVFCWTFIPAIAAVVQAIIAICKTADAEGKIII